MSKRSAIALAPGAPAAKRLQTEDPEDLYIDDGVDDDISVAQTPASVSEVGSPLTTATGSTTPRAKFPSDLKTLACTWPGCPKTFNRPARLRDHLNSHTNSRPFKCPYDGCDKDYIEDKHLKQHIKAVHTLERKHVCPREGCGKSFVTGTRLKRHQAVHEGEERFRCQECGQSFRKKETLHKHVRKDHLGKPAHECPEASCTEAFNSKAALKRHREREHGETRFWCGECGLKRMPDGTEQRVGFTTEVLLQAHVRAEHQNCMFCDFKSASRWEMERHIEMRHSGKTVEDRKTIACPHDGCSKMFTKRSNMTAHARIAHEGFRFVCGEVDLGNAPELAGWSNSQGCGSKFSSKVRLEDHVRYKHLGQERAKLTKPNTAPAADVISDLAGVTNQAKQNIFCPECPETFYRYHDFNAHFEREHQGGEAGASADPALFLTNIQRDLDQAPFADDTNKAPSAWLSSLEQEGIFAAEMDYGPAQDDWPEDEANILLLARDAENQDAFVDPALANI